MLYKMIKLQNFLFKVISFYFLLILNNQLLSFLSATIVVGEGFLKSTHKLQINN